jgi:hypothetical protein
MMDSSDTLGRCYVCNCDIQPHFFSFSDRTQQVAVDGKTITSLYAEETFRFCGKSCWDVIEQPIVASFNPIYQVFRITATCSKCRKPVDRAQPEVRGCGPFGTRTSTSAGNAGL